MAKAPAKPERGSPEAIGQELDRIEARISEIKGTLTILLGLRLLERGHGKNLGEACRIAEDLDRVRELEPGWFES